MNVGKIVCKNHDEWLIKRHKGIGGSDASAVLNLNPYRCAVDVYRDKKGLNPRENTSVQNDELLIYGSKAEEPIRELFKLDYPQFDFYHNENVIFYRLDKEYMCGSLDGFLVAKEDICITSYWKPNQFDNNFNQEQIKLIKKGMKGIWECKTTEVLSSMHKEKWDNRVPENYYIQILHYMNVMDADFCILRVKLKTKDMNGVVIHTFRDYVWLKEEVIEDLKIEEEGVTDFWLNYYLKDIEPSLKIIL